VRFFGVVVGLAYVDEDRLAPEFKVVARPNDWAKVVKETSRQSSVVTPLNARRQDFFIEVLEALKATQPTVHVARQTAEWNTFANTPYASGTWSPPATGSGSRCT
jgi:hypothetical protein